MASLDINGGIGPEGFSLNTEPSVRRRIYIQLDIKLYICFLFLSTFIDEINRMVFYSHFVKGLYHEKEIIKNKADFLFKEVVLDDLMSPNNYL